MKRNKIIMLALMAILFSSCSTENSSSNVNSSSEATSENSNSENSTTSNDDSKDDDDDGDEEQKATDLGKKSILEARNLCKQYIAESDLNVSKIAINKQYIVTIEGLAFYKTTLNKTTSKYGLNVSDPAKVFLGDDTGYIACASSSLLAKVGSYVGQEQSSYSVTGYLSIYLGHPEIYVTSFNWDSSLNKKFDAFTSSETLTSIDQFSDKASEIIYNCAGHGYGDVYTLKSLKCIYASRKDSKYVLSDGNKVVKVISSKNDIIFTVGSVYDVSGIITTLNYEPAFVAIATKSSDAEVEVSLETSAKEVSIDSLRANLKASQEDTDKRFDDFIKGHQEVYYANVYVSYCIESYKYYVTASDKQYTSSTVISGKKNAMSTYKMVTFENDELWNLSETELFADYNPLANYINEETTVKIYYIPFQIDYQKGEALWKVLLLSDYLPEIVEE